MKKVFKKVAVSALALTLAVGATTGLAACGGDDDDTVKVGILTASDVGSGEAKGFKDYFEGYIAKNYNVEFTYSATLTSNEAAKSQVETWTSQGYDAIIDMANLDRAGLAKYCNDNKVYYAIATGVMVENDWNVAKDYKYFLGQVGPDESAEYNAGLAMGQYYAAKNIDSIGIYGAFVPNPMHVNRLAGLITGLGGTYNGKTGTAIAGEIGFGAVDSTKIAVPGATISYMDGFGDGTDADGKNSFTEIGTMIATANLDAYLSVGMATTFFAGMLNEAHIEYSDIDSFTAANYGHFNTGSLGYLAGKYASSVGPVWALIQSAVNGKPIRDGGKAVSVVQNFAVAKTAAECNTYTESNGPVWTKTVLDTIISTSEKEVSFADFKTLVENDGKTA